MPSGSYRFDRFVLDPQDRRLRRDDEPIDVTGRYLEALTLLLREAGKLVSKDRFMDEVWRGVPVTDEALTQCVRTLRRQLGDDAASPRFIETVPRHGYRFIAPVEWREGETSGLAHSPAPPPVSGAAPTHHWRRFFLLSGAGTLGGSLAGLLGGLFYGFAGVFEPMQPGMGAASMLLVLVSITVLVATIGAAGVSFGIAAASRIDVRRALWPALGGAAGGLVTGAVVKLVGVDTFTLLFGQSPGDITGAGEGVLLGAGVGVGAWLALSGASLRRAALAGGLASAAAGAIAPFVGGRMMAGSLALVAENFPQSHLRLGEVGALFGERGFGPISQSVTGGLEGFVFGTCIVAALVLVRKAAGESA
jgi:DNA-binding winged helix-turn-helix (wHTH) protein